MASTLRPRFTSDQVPGWLWWLVTLLLQVFIAWVDNHSAYSFDFFYLIPVALSAWRGGVAYGLIFSLLGMLGWYINEINTQRHVEFLQREWKAIVQFVFLLSTALLLARLRSALAREKALAREDSLTGVSNSRAFYSALAAELERVRRHFAPLTLAYIDLDNFKTVNDRFGHAAGDEVLREITISLRDNTRKVDMIARLGGDEFALLMPNTNAEGARVCLEKVRSTIETKMKELRYPVTCSIGALACESQPPEAEALLKKADALMYNSKQGGKNKLTLETLV